MTRIIPLSFASLLALLGLLALATACSKSRTPELDAGADTGAPECPAGQELFSQGCDETPPTGAPIATGCYQQCAGEADTSCGDGLACTRTVTDPCVCADGEACCDACGAESWLCLSPPPPPAECGGRGYCDCNAGCEPLIDMSTGCFCECESPFNCSGEMCNCVCGGATYLGCAPSGHCTTTRVDCGSCDIIRVDGCPVCDPECSAAP